MFPLCKIKLHAYSPSPPPTHTHTHTHAETHKDLQNIVIRVLQEIRVDLERSWNVTGHRQLVPGKFYYACSIPLQSNINISELVSFFSMRENSKKCLTLAVQ